MNFSGLSVRLNDWLFKPTSPTPIALVRILIGLILLQNLVVHLLPDFGLYFGDHAIISNNAMITKFWSYQPTFDLMMILPPQEKWRFLFFLGLIVMTFFMTIGLFSRFSMVCVFLGLLSIDSHFELNQNDGDVFLRLACMILSCSNAGDAFSVDNIIKAFREDWRNIGFGPRLSAPWAQRWYQLQLAFVYCHTFFAKISGAHWIDGWAVYYASRYDDCQRFMLPFIFDNPITVKLFTWGTLVIEFALWTLVWFKEFRYWVLLSGLLLHLGIETTMNLPMFEWLFMSSYFVFVEPEDLTKVMNWLKSKIHAYFGQPLLLAYDGNSISSVRTVGVLHRLDIFGFLKPIDLRIADNTIYDTLKNIDKTKISDYTTMLQNGERWLTGFAAFRWMTLRLPILWLIIPLVYIPTFSWCVEQLFSWLVQHQYVLFGDTEPKYLAVQSQLTEG